MSDLIPARRDDLGRLFGERVSFDPQERRLYSHDVASLPHLIRPLAGDTTPDAVVQPDSEDELVKLVRWAAKSGVPLTPRGKATAGYGGAVPVRRGVVVDMRRFDRLLSVDRVGYTATVQAGIVWERLDHLLEPHGLTLCSYPSSYPSSSVGGWLAQGGVGYGSWRFGWFREVVVSARVVLPDGEVRDLSGDELDLVSDAEGITGFVTEITLRIMPREEPSVAAVSCASTPELLRVIRGVAEEDLPVWSMSFADPVMVDLTNACPPRAHPHEHRIDLPKGYILLLASPGAAGVRMLAGLKDVVRRAGAMLSDELARHEWADRFRVMRIKRVGPSLVPAEVVVPLSRLDGALEELGRRVRQPLAIEGLAVGKGPGGEPEVALLAFIPQDERTPGYDLVFGLSLSVVEVAEKLGGRVYATGLFFRHKAAEVLGRVASSVSRPSSASAIPRA